MEFLTHVGIGIVIFVSGLWGSVFGGNTLPTASAPAAIPSITTTSAPSTAELNQTSSSSSSNSQTGWQTSRGGFRVVNGMQEPILPPPGLVQSIENSAFTKDNQNVYYFGHPVTGADASSIQVFPADNFAYAAYARDKSHVYCGNDDGQAHVLGDADVRSFTPVLDTDGVASGFAIDTQRVFAGCDGLILNADPKTFVALDPYDMSGGYVKDATHVWRVDAPGGDISGSWGFSATLVTEADASTFDTIGTSVPGYPTADAEDKSHYYEAGTRLH